MALPRAQAISSLATQGIPSTLDTQTKVNQGQGQADMGLQQAVQAATATGAKTTAAQTQQTGAQQTQAKGQAALGAAGQAAQTGLANQEAALGSQALTQQGQLHQQKAKLDEEQLKLDETLSNTASSLKANLIDKQQQVFTDALGRSRFTEHQLMDWAVTKARSESELRTYAQKMNQMTQLKTQMLKSAHAQIVQQLQNASKLKEQRLDDALMRELAQAKAALEKKMAKEQAKRAGRAAMVQGIFTVAGAVVGSFIPGAGTAAGAMLGASVGGAVGGAVGQSDAAQKA